MHRYLLVPCLAACVLLALSACDRRVTYPPDESPAATTDVQPVGAGDASRPADSTNPDDHCADMEGEARRDCMARAESARDAPDIRP